MACVYVVHVSMSKREVPTCGIVIGPQAKILIESNCGIAVEAGAFGGSRQGENDIGAPRHSLPCLRQNVHRPAMVSGGRGGEPKLEKRVRIFRLQFHRDLERAPGALVMSRACGRPPQAKKDIEVLRIR